MISKIIAFLLSLIMVVPAMAPAQEKDTFNYVSFGASTTVGYGLDGFFPEEFYEDPTQIYADEGAGGARDGYFSSGYYYWPDNCYPQLLADKLQEYFGEEKTVNFKQCALNSMRAYDLLYLLDESTAADAYINWRLADWIEDLDAERDQTIEINGTEYTYKKDQTNIRKEFKDAVANADLITYDLGVNDFGVYLVNRISTALSDGIEEAYYDSNLENVIGEKAELYYQVRDLVKDLVAREYEIEFDEEKNEVVDFFADTLAYAFLGFTTSFDKSMEIIFDANPDVEVVVVSIQNLLKGYTAKIGDKEIAFGEIFGKVIDLANAYTTYLSPYASKCYNANVSENGRQEFFIDIVTSWDGQQETLPENIKKAFDIVEKKLQVRTMVGAFAADGVQQIADTMAQAQIVVGDAEKKILTDTLTDEACEAVYYILAKAIKASATEPCLSLEGAAAAEIVVNQMTSGIIPAAISAVGAKFIASFPKKLAGTGELEGFTEDIKNAIDLQLNKLFASDAAKSAFVIGVVSSFGNCYFYHPTEKGHADMLEIIFNAYVTKNNTKSQTINTLAAAIMAIVGESDADEKAQEIKDTINEKIDGVKNEIKDQLNKVEEKIEENIAEEKAENAAKLEELAKEQAAADKALEAERDELNGKIEKATENVTDIVEKAIDAVEDAKEFAEKVEDAKETAEEVQEKIAEVVENPEIIEEQVKEAVVEKAQEIQNEINEQICEKVVEQMTELEQAQADLIANKEELAAKAEVVTEKAKEVAEQVNNVANKVNKIIGFFKF